MSLQLLAFYRKVKNLQNSMSRQHSVKISQEENLKKDQPTIKKKAKNGQKKKSQKRFHIKLVLLFRFLILILFRSSCLEDEPQDHHTRQKEKEKEKVYFPNSSFSRSHRSAMDSFFKHNPTIHHIKDKDKSVEVISTIEKTTTYKIYINAQS